MCHCNNAVAAMLHVTSFRPIEEFYNTAGVGNNGKPVCDFLSVNSTNFHRNSHRFPVIAQCCNK